MRRGLELRRAATPREDGPFLALHPGASLRDVRLERYERLGRGDGRVRIRKVRVAVGECRGGVVGVSTYARARRVVARQPRHGLHQRPSTQRLEFLTRETTAESTLDEDGGGDGAVLAGDEARASARILRRRRERARRRRRAFARRRVRRLAMTRRERRRESLTRETPAEMTLERDRRRIRRRICRRRVCRRRVRRRRVRLGLCFCRRRVRLGLCSRGATRRRTLARRPRRRRESF